MCFHDNWVICIKYVFWGISFMWDIESRINSLNLRNSLTKQWYNSWLRIRHVKSLCHKTSMSANFLNKETILTKHQRVKSWLKNLLKCSKTLATTTWTRTWTIQSKLTRIQIDMWRCKGNSTFPEISNIAGKISTTMKISRTYCN